MANSTAEPVDPRRFGGSYSIAQWCMHRGISVSFFYKLKKQGTAPATKSLGRRQTITAEADAAWAAADDSASAAA